MKKKVLLYHIIHVAFFTVSFGQNLTLKIEGANDVETKQIDSISYFESHENYKSLKAEIDSTFSRLVSNGFLECKINSIEKTNDSTFLSLFHLGNKYESLTLYFETEFLKKEDLLALSSKATDSSITIPIPATKRTLQYLNNLIAEKGYPFASLSLNPITVDAQKNVFSSLVVKLNGGQRRIDAVVVKGYEKFPKSYIRHFLKIKKGTQFGIKDIEKKTQLLKNLRFASEIKPPEVLFKNDSTTLYLYIEKRKSNAFDGFLGFGTNEETNKIEFDGYLNLELNNNLNYGESLNLYYKSDENKQRTFNAQVTLPYLLKTPLGAEFELRIFKKDTLFTTATQIAKLFYQVNSKNRISLGIEAIQSNNLTSSSFSNVIEDYKTNLYTLEYQFREISETFSLFPFKSMISASAATGQRTFGGEKESQSKASLDASKIFDLNTKNSLYLRLNGSGLFSDTYFENELLRFGGINSIRGFEENSLAATAYGLLNLEYRYSLSPSMFVHTITDFCYLENNITEQKEKLYGFGFGFGILTQAGLFRLIYANGKSEDQSFKLSNSKVHLSLTAFF